MAAKRKSAAAKRRAPVRDRDPDPPGIVTRVCARVQAAFRPERLIVARAPEDALVLNILIANRSQLVTAEGIPTAAFSATAVGTRLDMDTAAPGHEIVIEVQTALGGGFSAVLLGTSGPNGQQYTLPFSGTLAGIDLLTEEAKKAVKWRADKKKPKAGPVKRGSGKIKRDARGNLIVQE